jgi:uncharacterized protein YceK
MKTIILVILFVLLNGCSEFAILMSGASVAASQNIYAKTYSGVDVLTIIKTDKSIKEHAYDKIKGE